jgi:hypothetical protein
MVPELALPPGPSSRSAPVPRPFPGFGGDDGRGRGRVQPARCVEGGGERRGGPVALDRRAWRFGSVLPRFMLSIRVAILVALWASTLHPHHVRAPSSTVRSQPEHRLRCEIRPSDPVWHLTSLPKCREDSSCCRFVPGRRHRLNRGGDRAANSALYIVTIGVSDTTKRP